MIDVTKLQQMSQKATARNDSVAEKVEETRRRKLEQKKKIDKAKAEQILDRLQRRCERAASRGERQAVVISKISRKDINQLHGGTYGSVCKRESLSGATAIVFDECEKVGLNRSQKSKEI